MTRVFIAAPLAGRDLSNLALVIPLRKTADPSSLGRFTGVFGSGAKERQHREHPARLAARRRQAELAEDARDVLLDRAEGDHEPVGDPLVRASGGHQLEHLALAWR